MADGASAMDNMADMEQLIGIDLGGTQIKCALFRATTGELLEKSILPTNDGEQIGGKPAWARAILETIEQWSPDHTTPVGLASPGIPSTDGKSMTSIPGRMNGLDGFQWTDEMDWQSKIPVLNDAHAALLGEIWQGAARGSANVTMLTLGTGVGGAAVVDGRLLRGHLGRAGHFGHMCLDPNGVQGITGTPGSLEDSIGNSTVGRRSAGKFDSTRDLLEAYLDSDSFAKQVWDKSVQHLAGGITSLINALDPEIVLLAGGLTQAGELLTGPLEKELDRIEWRPDGKKVDLRIADLADWAGVYGAAYRAGKEFSPTNSNDTD